MTMRSSRDINRELRIVRSFVAREMAAYDQLSRPSRIKYERAMQSCVDDDALSFPTFKCMHGLWKFEPCTKCGRDADACKQYVVLMQSRIKELLEVLE